MKFRTLSSILPAIRRLGSVQPIRGRVHKVSVVAGGEVSIVMRFGIDEPRARNLNQGELLDVVPHTAGRLADAILSKEQARAAAEETKK